MSTALLLLPDFLLIACGFCLCRWTALNRPVWEAAERLVYWLLFPVLLFNSVMRSPIDPSTTLTMTATAIAMLLCGIALVAAMRWWPGLDLWRHASGAQVAFRFNSFVALALAERLGGGSGVAAMALLLAVGVPLCNVAAVGFLARHGGQGLFRELARNPLIIATLLGLAGNLMGLRFPEAVGTTLQRIGVAALPVGLLAVGAGLQLGGLKAAPGLATSLLGVRHVAMPLIAIGLTMLVGLSPEQQLIVVLFGAMPTASSAYVLAARMGGDGPFVAGLVSMSTLVGMVSIPFWLAALARVTGA